MEAVDPEKAPHLTLPPGPNVKVRKRGRPKGSKNAPVLARPPSRAAGADYAHADIETIISRQLSLIDWAQQALRNEMMRAYQGKGLSIQSTDLNRLETLSNTIVRTVAGLKASSDLAEEIAKRLSPSQLLEAALQKIEAQDRATIRACIRRLRESFAKLGPVRGQDEQAMAPQTKRAATAVAALEDE